jgi:hypothetical protein
VCSNRRQLVNRSPFQRPNNHDTSPACHQKHPKQHNNPFTQRIDINTRRLRPGGERGADATTRRRAEGSSGYNPRRSKIPAAWEDKGFDRRHDSGRCTEKLEIFIPVRERHEKSVITPLFDRDKDFQFFGAPPGVMPPVNNPSPAPTLGSSTAVSPRMVALLLPARNHLLERRPDL